MVFVHDIDVTEVKESRLPKELLDRLHQTVSPKIEPAMEAFSDLTTKVNC